jgi:hypothetical protein
MRVYRVQDAEGRGPFRPGVPAVWADEFFAPGMDEMPSWMEEFGADLINRKGLPGEYFGTAVRLLGHLRKWFSCAEMARLDALGYRPVCLTIQRILAESGNQLIFARRAPLAKGALLVPWPAEIANASATADRPKAVTPNGAIRICVLKAMP